MRVFIDLTGNFLYSYYIEMVSLQIRCDVLIRQTNKRREDLWVRAAYRDYWSNCKEHLAEIRPDNMKECLIRVNREGTLAVQNST